jgi:hypothetical protein
LKSVEVVELTKRLLELRRALVLGICRLLAPCVVSVFVFWLPTLLIFELEERSMGILGYHASVP